jgi:hypothetical protein
VRGVQPSEAPVYDLPVTPLRWDGDERGRGIASGASARPDLDRLAAEMSEPDWIAEEPEAHLLPHLRAAVERPDSRWRLDQAAMDDEGRYVVDLAWVGTEGPPSPGQLRAEIFPLVGAIAEPSTHVRERRAHGGAEFEVTTGILDGDAGWRGHGHVLLFRIALPVASS